MYAGYCLKYSFNNYFTDIGLNLTSKIDTTAKYPFQHYLRTPTTSKFNLQFTNANEILNVINKLPTKTSSGHDQLSCKILKEIKDMISEPLSLLTNQVFNTNIFPAKLKLAKVIPLYKKGDVSSIENYRPISLLSSFSKVIEKIIFNHLFDFFQCSNLFYNSQYGFRNNHSTEFAALELIDIIQKELDAKHDSLAVFLDMSKAFDTIDHTILLKKYYGIQHKSLNLFKNYLSERYQYVSVGNTEYTHCKINTGVPQSSILGALLFRIYINDIHNATDAFTFILYADDTTPISNISKFKTTNAPNRSTENINDELGKIRNWLAVNKLSLNASKSNYMVFHHKQKQLNPDSISILEINRTQIKLVEELNLLGITINEFLDWNSHTIKISNKLLRAIGIMHKLRKIIPMQILKLMYSSMILYFGITAWGFTCRRVYGLQNKAIRIIKKSKFNAHTEPLFRELSLLKVNHIFQLQCLKLYYKHNKRKNTCICLKYVRIE